MTAERFLSNELPKDHALQRYLKSDDAGMRLVGRLLAPYYLPAEAVTDAAAILERHAAIILAGHDLPADGALSYRDVLHANLLEAEDLLRSGIYNQQHVETTLATIAAFKEKIAAPAADSEIDVREEQTVFLLLDSLLDDSTVRKISSIGQAYYPIVAPQVERLTGVYPKATVVAVNDEIFPGGLSGKRGPSVATFSKQLGLPLVVISASSFDLEELRAGYVGSFEEAIKHELIHATQPDVTLAQRTTLDEIAVEAATEFLTLWPDITDISSGYANMLLVSEAVRRQRGFADAETFYRTLSAMSDEQRRATMGKLIAGRTLSEEGMLDALNTRLETLLKSIDDQLLVLLDDERPEWGTALLGSVSRELARIEQQIDILHPVVEWQPQPEQVEAGVGDLDL